jgi:hypothetical protein
MNEPVPSLHSLNNDLIQSHYIEVAQGPVDQDTIGCEYLAYFEPNKIKKKMSSTPWGQVGK